VFKNKKYNLIYLLSIYYLNADNNNNFFNDAAIIGNSIVSATSILARQNELSEFKKLIFDQNVNKAELLCSVLTGYDYDLLEMLLISSTQIDMNDRKAFFNNSPINQLLNNTNFSKAEKIDAIRLLINRGADVNGYDARGETPLFYAIRCQVRDYAALLLKNGADVNWQNNDGYTPVMCAINCNKKYLLDELINATKVVNLKLKNQAGLTTLDMLIDANRYDLFKRLARNAKYKHYFNDVNLLARAIEKNCKLAVIKDIISLLDKNELNRQTNAGYTALMLAVNADRLEIVKLLIKAGAEPKQAVCLKPAAGEKANANKELGFSTAEITVDAKKIAIEKNNKKMINYFASIGV
jgi:ankyrin repeat protein